MQAAKATQPPRTIQGHIRWGWVEAITAPVATVVAAVDFAYSQGKASDYSAVVVVGVPLAVVVVPSLQVVTVVGVVVVIRWTTTSISLKI